MSDSHNIYAILELSDLNFITLSKISLRSTITHYSKIEYKGKESLFLRPSYAADGTYSYHKNKRLCHKYFHYTVCTKTVRIKYRNYT